ncbi:MAG: EamA family transporter RarD [Deltaproteobacteria bacterium]|nr:MAG: EamA family transporter RarD [Deltaproteobacteria bacterium]
MKKGILLAIGAYVLWGLFPLYWKQLQVIPAKEIVAHRIVWSLVFLGIILSLRKEIQKALSTARQLRIIAIYACSAVLLFINWLTYIWAVNSGYIVDASLGYFINPLVSVLLGIIFFRERLRIGQWAAIILAGIGVGYLTFKYGSLPWIGLVLAFSFGTYGLIKKLAPLEALEGQTIEMGILTFPALFFLIYLEAHHTASFGHAGVTPTLLLILGGAVTATPLLMFSAAARQIPLSMIGILQYLAPTLQFSIGVWVYGEAFPRYKLIGYSLVWSALLVYTLEGFRHQQKTKKDRKFKAVPTS